jgi:hypothetical protein
MRGALRDPFVRSTAVLVALTAVGLVAVGVAWRGLAATTVVSEQLAYATSGALGGLALVGFALGVVAIQLGRRARARQRAHLDTLVAAAADLLDAVRAGR